MAPTYRAGNDAVAASDISPIVSPLPSPSVERSPPLLHAQQQPLASTATTSSTHLAPQQLNEKSAPPHSGPPSGSSPSIPPRVQVTPSSRTEFTVDWLVKVLTLVSAVLFGIWAPLSYQASVESSATTDAAVASLASQQSRLASSVAGISGLNAQQNAIDDLTDRVRLLGMLNLIDFCRSNEDVEGCADVVQPSAIASVVAGLALEPAQQSAAPTPTDVQSDVDDNSDSKEPGGKGGKGRTGSGLPIGAIMGIVWGCLAAVGVAVGALVWRWRRNERKRRFELRGEKGGLKPIFEIEESN